MTIEEPVYLRLLRDLERAFPRPRNVDFFGNLVDHALTGAIGAI